MDTIEQSRPKHELKSPAHLALLPSLYDDMPDEVADALDYITEPLEGQKEYKQESKKKQG